jgi:hypothetical protein
LLLRVALLLRFVWPNADNFAVGWLRIAPRSDKSVEFHEFAMAFGAKTHPFFSPS